MGDKKSTGSMNAQESELGFPSGKKGTIPVKPSIQTWCLVCTRHPVATSTIIIILRGRAGPTLPWGYPTQTPSCLPSGCSGEGTPPGSELAFCASSQRGARLVLSQFTLEEMEARRGQGHTVSGSRFKARRGQEGPSSAVRPPSGAGRGSWACPVV